LVPVLLLFRIVILLAMVLNPLVVYLERRRVPRPAGVALVLIALAAIVVLVVAVAVPTFTDQLQLLIQRAPAFNHWCGRRAFYFRFCRSASDFCAFESAAADRWLSGGYTRSSSRKSAAHSDPDDGTNDGMGAWSRHQWRNHRCVHWHFIVGR